MYLKSLQMVGFKSFADRTRFDFNPGMTSIVGPNGCGKSNIADAVRWVIGEQSAKALRGSKMEDCIFGGTDDRKPLGMAEVAITFTDCEALLGTEYNEVTVTRRVFRTGEGQYLLNKKPCRLKDIQRLFMDTGMGTPSYSLMEQGRIDRVLSSRPEDRRAVFEEASGITKYKVDRKEAIRKLEQTEANLLRLADVIREVKRQIGSLQRQAGKARRYKTFRERLRSLDIHLTRRELAAADERIGEMTARAAGLAGELSAAAAEVEEMEQGNAHLRENLMRTEREVGQLQESGVQSSTRLDHTRETIEGNRQHIEEYRQWAARDAREAEEIEGQVEARRRQLAGATSEEEAARAASGETEAALREANNGQEAHREQVDRARAHLEQLRGESVELESLASRLQNELVEIESRQRSSVINRERLAAEKGQLARVAESYGRRQAAMDAELTQRQRDLDAAAQAMRALEEELAELDRHARETERDLAELQSQAAARQARVDMIRESDAAGDAFPAGARLLLNEPATLNVDRDRVLGALAEQIETEPDYRLAAEAALRTWLDAVLVRDAAAGLAVIRALQSRRAGAARLLVAEGPAATSPQAPPDGDRLVAHVRCDEAIRPLLHRLIGNVLVVGSCDRIPSPVPAGRVYVTRDGAVARGDGSMELWMPDSAAANPLTRKHSLAEAEAGLHTVGEQAAQRKAAAETLGSRMEQTRPQLAAARERLDAAKRAMAQKEGESQVVSREATEARERLETVAWELQSLASEGSTEDSRKQEAAQKLSEIRTQREDQTQSIDAQTRELRVLENRFTEIQSSVTEHRIAFTSARQRLENLAGQCESLRSRVQELEQAHNSRIEGIASYEQSIERLTSEIENGERLVVELEAAVAANRDRVDSLRRNREKQATELAGLEQMLSSKRSAMDDVRARKSDMEVKLAELRTRRQNRLERVTAEYRIPAEQLDDEPEPEWESGAPSDEEVETQIAELRAKIEAIGPVNLVAIEEYRELEQRYAFLTTQEEDLAKAKQQLLDMIRKINRTTSDLFRTTFEQVNRNFETMFTRLFNGGTAKLVLVNEEDVLECGIEIIARPPGKRLQNVSLLSGGERTLTAVALLFAIYMIRPSPFCLLDELDAALDDANIGRFVEVLQGFLDQSQFMVITHNRRTIAAADVLYGITMPEKGISKVVSMKFNEAPAAVNA